MEQTYITPRISFMEGFGAQWMWCELVLEQSDASLHLPVMLAKFSFLCAFERQPQLQQMISFRPEPLVPRTHLPSSLHDLPWFAFRFARLRFFWCQAWLRCGALPTFATSGMGQWASDGKSGMFVVCCTWEKWFCKGMCPTALPITIVAISSLKYSMSLWVIVCRWSKKSKEKTPKPRWSGRCGSVVVTCSGSSFGRDEPRHVGRPMALRWKFARSDWLPTAILRV